jgi:glycerol-3-phosphate dehydrogenase (NAD(P)+)
VPVVSCVKGIELTTGRRPSQIIMQDGGAKAVAVLSGPNIAAEVVRRKPAGAVVACEDAILGERVRATFATDYFRVYTNEDVIGVELAGATKNVIALAAGIIDGLALGNNAKASLITRGIVEIARLGVSLGASAETFYGLAGIGDLITTCVSPEGRNRTVGEAVARGKPLQQVLAELGSVAEGVPTTRAVRELARSRGIELPICEAVYVVLFEGKPVRDAILELMTREPKAERH